MSTRLLIPYSSSGMHFQHSPHSEMKLVNCIRGEIWDVAVDVRANSPTFLRWHAERLSAVNGRSLLIPEGFAHGFQALTDDAELIYCHSTAFDAKAEAGLNPLDARLAIAWPIAITEISARDAGQKHIGTAFEGVNL
jgi:dTDP-4-dehydrorhamnose 3,5-epimerase